MINQGFREEYVVSKNLRIRSSGGQNTLPAATLRRTNIKEGGLLYESDLLKFRLNRLRFDNRAICKLPLSEA